MSSDKVLSKKAFYLIVLGFVLVGLGVLCIDFMFLDWVVKRPMLM